MSEQCECEDCREVRMHVAYFRLTGKYLIPPPAPIPLSLEALMQDEDFGEQESGE